MHITFTETVEPPAAITTFRKGRTYLMPDEMARGFIEAGVAEERRSDDQTAAPQPLDETHEPDDD